MRPDSAGPIRCSLVSDSADAHRVRHPSPPSEQSKSEQRVPLFVPAGQTRSAPDDAPIPGLSAAGRTAVNLGAAKAIREALSSGRSTSGLVLHVESDTCAVVDRAELVASLRRAGVTRLARDVERALVGRDHVLVLIDVDGSTGVLTIPLAEVLGDQPEDHPACLKTQ